MSNIIQYFEPSYKWRENIKQQFFFFFFKKIKFIFCPHIWGLSIVGALDDGLIGLGLGPA